MTLLQVLTKDSVTVSVDAVVYYRVSNAVVSVANVENAHHSTRYQEPHHNSTSNVFLTLKASGSDFAQEHFGDKKPARNTQR